MMILDSGLLFWATLYISLNNKKFLLSMLLFIRGMVKLWERSRRL